MQPAISLDDFDVLPGFKPLSLRGPFFGGRTLLTDRNGRGDGMMIRITDSDCNALGITHGGVIATLADIFLVHFLARRLPAATGLVTSSLAVDYVGRSTAGDWLSGRIHAHHIGRRLCVASGELRVGERTIALISASCAVFDSTRNPT
ncbi:MAG TPA: PaaI family thioesterase [Methyloversatilis sp.]